jgi:hypothetical protein
MDTRPLLDKLIYFYQSFFGTKNCWILMQSALATHFMDAKHF